MLMHTVDFKVATVFPEERRVKQSWIATAGLLSTAQECWSQKTELPKNFLRRDESEWEGMKDGASAPSGTCSVDVLYGNFVFTTARVKVLSTDSIYFYRQLEGWRMGHPCYRGAKVVH